MHCPRDFAEDGDITRRRSRRLSRSFRSRNAYRRRNQANSAKHEPIERVILVGREREHRPTHSQPKRDTPLRLGHADTRQNQAIKTLACNRLRRHAHSPKTPPTSSPFTRRSPHAFDSTKSPNRRATPPSHRLAHAMRVHLRRRVVSLRHGRPQTTPQSHNLFRIVRAYDSNTVFYISS